jgi:hypothetical protein
MHASTTWMVEGGVGSHACTQHSYAHRAHATPCWHIVHQAYSRHQQTADCLHAVRVHRMAAFWGMLLAVAQQWHIEWHIQSPCMHLPAPSAPVHQQRFGREDLRPAQAVVQVSCLGENGFPYTFASHPVFQPHTPFSDSGSREPSILSFTSMHSCTMHAQEKAPTLQ